MPEWGFAVDGRRIRRRGRGRSPWPLARPVVARRPDRARRRAGDHRNFAFQIPANSGHSSTSVLICLIIDRQREL